MLITVIGLLLFRKYGSSADQTKQLEVDNEQMEKRLRELKTAMGREKAQREYELLLSIINSQCLNSDLHKTTKKLLTDGLTNYF